MLSSFGRMTFTMTSNASRVRSAAGAAAVAITALLLVAACGPDLDPLDAPRAEPVSNRGQLLSSTPLADYDAGPFNPRGRSDLLERGQGC